MSENLVIAGVTFNNVTGIKATDTSDNTVTYMKGAYVADDWMDFTKPTGAVYSDIAMTDGAGTYPAVFQSHTGLTSINLPNATGLVANFCRSCTNLATVSMPKVTKTNGFCFAGTAITYAVFPSMNNVYGGSDFSGCTSLLAADFGGDFVSTYRGIAAFTFNGSTKFSTLVLRSSVAWNLQNINAFNQTCFKSGGTGGTLYVPNDLISTYQGATNWSTILGYTNNQIKSIESTHTDPNAPIDLTTHYVDGTLIPTT